MCTCACVAICIPAVLHSSEHHMCESANACLSTYAPVSVEQGVDEDGCAFCMYTHTNLLRSTHWSTHVPADGSTVHLQVASVRLSVCLPVCLSVGRSARLSVCLSCRPPLWLSVCVTVPRRNCLFLSLIPRAHTLELQPTAQ